MRQPVEEPGVAPAQQVERVAVVGWQPLMRLPRPVLYMGAEWAKMLQACLVARLVSDKPDYAATALRYFTALSTTSSTSATQGRRQGRRGWRRVERRPGCTIAAAPEVPCVVVDELA